MNVSGNLERLLPSLYEFLSEHPSDAHTRLSPASIEGLTARLDSGSSSGSGDINATGSAAAAFSLPSPDLSCTAPAIIAESYARWRRCITVWRTVIGNDSVFLAVLLHSGCLWCPDYAALHQELHNIAMRTRQKQSSAQPAPLSKGTPVSDVGSEVAERKHADNLPVHRTAPTSDGPPNTPVKRRGKRGVKVAAGAAAHSVRALAAAAEAHAELAAACPASVWALHVLHFLRVEEVCALPRSSGTAKFNRKRNEVTSDFVSESFLGDSTDCSEGDLSATGSNNHISRSNSTYSDSSMGSEWAGSDGINGAVESRLMKRRRLATGQGACERWGRGDDGRYRSVKGQRGAGQGRRGEASSANARRKGPRRHEEVRACPAGSQFDVPQRQLVTSSSLLPKLPGNEKNGASGGSKGLSSTLAAVFSLLQQKEEEQQQHRISVCRHDESADGGAAVKTQGKDHSDKPLESARCDTYDCGTGARNGTRVTAQQKHTLLLRATTSLVSEEEPLVQQVATALVNEWLDLLSVDVSLPPPWEATARASTVTKNEETSSLCGSATGGLCSAPPRRSAPTGVSPASCTETSKQMLWRRRVCDARHYWFSSLLKMVAYLDGAHSALREENIHMSAVLARQGIAPHDAEDIFTKSLPAIFTCALVEEVLHSGTAALRASKPRAFAASSAPSVLASASAASSLRLWMPPSVLLLPFHMIGQGSMFRVCVPPGAVSDGAPISYTRTATRAQGHFVSCVVDSYGLHLGVEPRRMAEAHDPSHQAVGADGVGGSAALHPSNRESVNMGGQGTAASSFHSGSSPGHCQLGFAVRCGDLESLLDPRYVASLQHLLPILRVSDMTSECATASNICGGQLKQNPSVRWWSCTSRETAGSPCMDLYVARTLLMLPIPAQSTVDTTTNRSASTTSIDGDAATRRAAADGLHPVRSRTGNTLGAQTSMSLAVVTAKRSRRGSRRGTAVSADEQSVRRLHPLLYHAMRLHLRAERLACKTNSRCSEEDAAELVLLYGHPLGKETTALRHMGFTVRTNNHTRPGRGSGTSGSIGAHYTRDMGSLAVTSAAGLSDGAGGGGGRLTLSRDALGTTLEGMYLVARRVLGLQGLFVSSASSAATSSSSAAAAAAHTSDKGGSPVTGVAALVEEGSCASTTGIGTANATASSISSQTEREALGTAAATLALTCLVLSHSLLDDLHQQPTLVLWTTELASFILDVSLLMPRPIPRLLRADGFALALLLQPAQSMLLMVGLAATLVTREVRIDGAPNRGGGRARDTGGAPSPLRPVAPQWYPWWSAFRAAVLRDTELPRCLYSGLWPIIEKAEDTLATFAAEARWDTPDKRQAGNCRRSHSSPTAERCGREEGSAMTTAANVSARGGRHHGGAGGGRRVLSLSASSTSADVGRRAVVDVQSASSRKSDTHCRGRYVDSDPPRVRSLVLSAPSLNDAVGELSLNAAPHHSGPGRECQAGSTMPADQSCAPRRLCGPAVLCQDDDACRTGTGTKSTQAVVGAPLFAERVTVLPGNEMALLRGSPVHTEAASSSSGMLSLSLTRKTLPPPPRLTSAFASALWASLEAEEMCWPTGSA
ncbi:hypothetical protein JKF63_07469 [Porcisia hertigi]|uniref:Uncharacterized protein n=1 Tax=Porcisia hertigi TaxID=2761500 RepID=A0A836LF83_9TRYP|nr:hypothetical protein JKF63_07469 [Porcisia hertigi]